MRLIMHILYNQSQPLYSYFSMYNVHALLNLFSGVLRFSPLENFSAYRFGSYYAER
jgi:hypothetical protein